MAILSETLRDRHCDFSIMWVIIPSEEIAIQMQVLPKPDPLDIAKQKADLMRKQLIDHGADHDATELSEKARDLMTAIEQLKALRQTVSLDGFSVRELREDGRRF